MKRTFLVISLCLVLALILAACGSGSSDKKTEDSEPEVVEEAAEGYDILGRQLWEVRGLRDEYGRVYDVMDNADLASSYSAYFLSFDSDGTYSFTSKFPNKGSYSPYKGDGANYSFLLKVEEVYRWDTDNKKFVEAESANTKSYIVTVLDSDTIEYVEFDGVTGKGKANEISMLLTKLRKSSSYIDDNKIEISPSTNSSSTDEDTSDSSSDDAPQLSSYQAIYDEYVKRMEDATPRLVSEYKSEASGTSDINRLAEICTDKVEDLAEISTEGMEKMAELQQSKGDSYDTYESWAMKLQDKYMDLAQEIQDAYLNSTF